MTAWLVIAAVGAGSYAMRAVMLTTVATRPLSPRSQAAMAHVAPAAVAALTATLVFTKAGSVQALPVPELTALAVGFVAVRRTGNVLHAIVFGFPVLWLLTALGG